MKQFYGFGTLDDMRAELRPQLVETLMGGKVKRTDMTVCRREKGRCRGSLPINAAGDVEAGGTWMFVYEDGDPDFGIIETMCTVEYKGDTYAWTETKEV